MSPSTNSASVGWGSDGRRFSSRVVVGYPMGMDLGRAWIGCVLMVLLWSPTAFAFECKSPEGRANVSLRWNNRTIPWGIQAGSAEALEETVMAASFTAWSLPPCTDLQFQYVGLVSASDPVNQLSVIESGWTEDRPREAVAVTQTQFQPSTGWISRSDIEVNRELFVFGNTQLSCDGSVYDLQSVMTHEVGHFIGLGHTREWTGQPTDPTMAPSVDQCEFDKRSLEDDDREGVCFLYPINEPSGQCVVESFVTPPKIGGSSFGCRATHDASGSAGWGISLLLGWVAFARFRARNGSNTCPQVRSAG